MTDAHQMALAQQVDAVFAHHPELSGADHRQRFPWLTGALGNPQTPIWFLAENPSLSKVEQATDPIEDAPTIQAQWWAGKGDKLFRELLVKYGFKNGTIDSHDGWNCYITNVIKEADYAERWRGSPSERLRQAALTWAPVLQWQLEVGKPRLIVALGKTVEGIVNQLKRSGMRFPEIKRIHHYSYIAHRANGERGPMHPDRVREYDEQFADIAMISIET
ncbi:uracil-DNA glycosylase family protein [Halothiobacillus sp.]|uniref:uracil-DNA glycosylase family protein n=1 Tax=Halothiobacillus sp. TaxID=1891311 RepID=UPI00261B06B5|nr:uracil-DNA glycosylase family protein [Halothiobacillus sp.]